MNWNAGEVPEMLESYLFIYLFIFGRRVNDNFFEALKLLLPNNQTATLASDFGSRPMRENNLSIHTESGNLYYSGLNPGESFYDFVLSQKNTTKKKSYCYMVVLLKTI